MWSIALKTLIADRGKLFTALVGVVFSVVLVNIQGGLFIGLIKKAALLVEYGGADIWVGHRSMHAVDFPGEIPARWVHRLRSIPEVAQAEPYLMGFTTMSLPSGGYEGAIVIGVDRASLLGNVTSTAPRIAAAILQTDGIIVDATDDAKFEYPEIGQIRELGGQRARIAGKSYGVTSFLVTPYVFTTLKRAHSFLNTRRSSCSYILVKLREGVDAERISQIIRQRLPEADALPSEDFAWVSIDYWMTRTGLGISFGASTILGLLVGLVMIGQTLYALVLDRLAEFGTLKAIGATEQQVHCLLLAQAIGIAVVGSILGLVLVVAVQAVYNTPRAPIVIPWWLSLISCVLVLIICLVSSVLPYFRVRHVDPLMVMQS